MCGDYMLERPVLQGYADYDRRLGQSPTQSKGPQVHVCAAPFFETFGILALAVSCQGATLWGRGDALWVHCAASQIGDNAYA